MVEQLQTKTETFRLKSFKKLREGMSQEGRVLIETKTAEELAEVKWCEGGFYLHRCQGDTAEGNYL